MFGGYALCAVLFEAIGGTNVVTLSGQNGIGMFRTNPLSGYVVQSVDEGSDLHLSGITPWRDRFSHPRRVPTQIP